MYYRNRNYNHYKNGRKKSTVFIAVMVLILLITPGVAYLRKNLNINGASDLSRQNWDVHFQNIVVTPGSVTPTSGNEATISPSDNKLINYTVPLDMPGDFYEFTVEVVNNGTIDAMVDTITSRLNGDVITDSTFASDGNLNFIKYSVSYSDGYAIESKHLLSPNEVEIYKVRVEYSRDIVPSDLEKVPDGGFNAVFSFNVSYTQADNTAIIREYVSPRAKILGTPGNVEGVNISTTDHENELRFIGANPNNYVYFNGNQKWRIIGIFDGKLKLIQDSIGGYSWDTSRTNVNNGYGVNQWGASGSYTGADLMKLLNPGYENNRDLQCKTTVTNTDSKFHCGDDSDSAFNSDVLVNNSLYWNGGSGLCYSSGSYQTKSCDFSTTGLTDATSRNMIDDATWYLGTHSTSVDPYGGAMTAENMYNWERQSTNLGKQCSNATYCSDTVNRTATWTGKVGLLYPSDYIYATAGGNTYDRETCLTVSAGYSSGSVENWTNTYTDCYQNDWLKLSSWYWSLSPRAGSGLSSGVFSVYSSGYVDHDGADYAGAVRPVVYLKSSVTFAHQGNGTQSKPFVLKYASS